MKSISISYLLLLLVSGIRAGENAVNNHEKLKPYDRPVPPCPEQKVWKFNGRTAFSGSCEFCPPDTKWRMGENDRGVCDEIPKKGYGPGPVPLPGPLPNPNPVPLPNPGPLPNPNPNPGPFPNPNPVPLPNPGPFPNPNPNPGPFPNPNPNPGPFPNPNPGPLPNPGPFPNPNPGPRPVTGPSDCRQGEIYFSSSRTCGACPLGTVYKKLPNGQAICARTSIPPPPPPPLPPSVCISGQFDFLIGAKLKGDIFSLANGGSFSLSNLPLGFRILVQGQSSAGIPRGTLIIEVTQEWDCQRVIRVYCC